MGWRPGSGGEEVWRRVTEVPARLQKPNVSEALAQIWDGGIRDVLLFLSRRDLATRSARFVLEIWSFCRISTACRGSR